VVVQAFITHTFINESPHPPPHYFHIDGRDLRCANSGACSCRGSKRAEKCGWNCGKWFRKNNFQST
jgi:hypothetical protein